MFYLVDESGDVFGKQKSFEALDKKRRTIYNKTKNDLRLFIVDLKGTVLAPHRVMGEIGKWKTKGYERIKFFPPVLGWRQESARHALAAKGMKTGRKKHKQYKYYRT